jgi:hypothetical protein
MQPAAPCCHDPQVGEWGPHYGFQDTKPAPLDLRLSVDDVILATIPQLKEWCKAQGMPVGCV